MEFRLHNSIDHLYNIFLENDGLEKCAQLLEEEVNKMYGTKYLNDEHDCNVVSMNSLNIHDANDMQSHTLGDAMFYEDVRKSHRNNMPTPQSEGITWTNRIGSACNPLRVTSQELTRL